MCSAGASLPAIRRSHRAELVNTSKNFIAEISLTSSSRPLSFLSNISFSRRFAGLWFPSRRMFSRFQRTRGHPLTRCLQTILIQSTNTAFCRAMNPRNIFLGVLSGTMFMMKKFTPAGRGTLKKFFQKYFPEPLRRFSGRERPPMPIPKERAAAPCSLQNVSVPYEYQKGSEGNV